MVHKHERDTHGHYSQKLNYDSFKVEFTSCMVESPWIGNVYKKCDGQNQSLRIFY